MSTRPSSGNSGSTNEARPADLLPPNWAELSPFLDELLDAPVEDRATRVVELSRGDPTRQRELEQLLAEAARETPFLEGPVAGRFTELVTDASASSLPAVLADRYRVGRVLGRGGMASVYLARDEKHGRDVAIKVIKSDLSASLGHERFLREIEIAARLRHPNIVPLYDSGEANGSLFFVMPYEDGQSLRERLRQSGALPIADAVSVLRDVARALAYAHEHGVVHRDIKPDNVMLSGGAAVVTDFGIAKAVSAALTDAGDATLTQAGTVIGTPTYMAPEQATGDAAIDHRADIYSFGCLGYELVAGHPPFQEPRTHLLIAAHLATVPRPIDELRPDAPPAVAELLTRCLAKAPADRPQNARELVSVLDGATGVSTPSPRTTDTPVNRRPRSVRTWAAAGALLSAIAVIGTYFATRPAAVAAPLTVAVLPFANIAGDTATDLIADALPDEVASALARVPGILIKSRAGARAYRGQLAPDVTEAGSRLKADYLMTAVVRQDAGRWVLSADFERATDASSVWSDTFLVRPNDQATAADSIAGRLTAELRRLFPGTVGLPRARSPNQRPTSTEAYRLYLLGRELLARRHQSVRKAEEAFRQAIQQDSLFAPAYSGLSMALVLTPWLHKVRPAEVRDDIVRAANRALALDPTLSLPHVALALAEFQAFRWTKAAEELETAIRLDPRNVEARVQYARLLYSTGRYADALVQLRAARNEDPASALVLSHTAWTYLASGEKDSALKEIGRALDTDSASASTVLIGAWVYLANDRPQEAHALAVRTEAGNLALGYFLAETGDTLGARQLLRGMDAGPPAWGDETRRGLTYLGLGDTASALAALEHATEARQIWPQSVPVFLGVYDGVRGSARFRVLLERVGLGEYISTLTR